MLVVLDTHPQFIIQKEPIDIFLKFEKCSAEEYCETINFDYELFKKVYNNDLSLSIKELISFANAFNLTLREFVVVV